MSVRTTQRSLADARRWMALGQSLMTRGVKALSEDDFAGDSLLPGWTRKHLIAHVAANSEAIFNLVRWAATGIETPMYASPVARAAGIAKGPTMSGEELDAWLHRSDELLAEAMDRLTPKQWECQVITAQGRIVPATETPWMRAREVCVHAVDLDTGITFTDLPGDLLHALVDDIATKRGLTDLPAGDLPQVAAWLSGRPYDTDALADAPELGPWL